MEGIDEILQEIGDHAETIKEAILKVAERESYDKDVVEIMRKSFADLSSVILKFKAIDLTPVVNIANDISKQNVSIMNMVGRLIHSPNNDSLIEKISAMIKSNNELVSKALVKTDYSVQLKTIADNLRQDKIDSLELVRNRQGIVEKVNVNYKK